jgi:hypothetical protein
MLSSMRTQMSLRRVAGIVGVTGGADAKGLEPRLGDVDRSGGRPPGRSRS